MVYNEVRVTLLSEESRRKQHGEEKSSLSALNVRGRSSVKVDLNCGSSKLRNFRDPDRDKARGVLLLS